MQLRSIPYYSLLIGLFGMAYYWLSPNIFSGTSLPIQHDVLFLSRPIPQGYGSFYWRTGENMPGMGVVMPGDMPGVGPRSRFRVCPGGQLIKRNLDGSLDTLIDGNNPEAPYFLTDIKHFDINYDGTKIVLAAAPEGNYPALAFDTLNPSQGFAQSPGVWRLYTMDIDGSNLQQITFDDLDTTGYSRYAGPYGDNSIFYKYDDIDPCWLPDGRIVFASTRWPAFAQYTGVRVTNLYTIEADGSNMRRITAERNSAERPTVDPLTGKIVFSRWWRNFRYPRHSMETTPNTEYVPPGLDEGYDSHLGLTHRRSLIAGEEEGILPRDNMFRNSWQAHQVNPDGSGLSMYSGFRRSESWNHYYWGCFSDAGDLYGNFFPMHNMTEAAGFGGIRKYKRGPGQAEPVIGVTDLRNNPSRDFVVPSGRNISYGIYKSAYAGEPCPINEDQVLISWLPNDENRIFQDYGIWVLHPETGQLDSVYNMAGRTELLAKAIRSRTLPPVVADASSNIPSNVTPLEDGPYAGDGTFRFEALNVYFNAPVDTDIVSAPKIGEAKSIRFFTDFQRHNPGSFGNLDWPILLDELPIDEYGKVVKDDLPAHLPLFEQLRTSSEDGYKVPFTGGPFPDGAAHVAGMNFDQAGSVARCVGCHAGHTMIPIPGDLEAIRYTNLAPGAQLSFSSVLDSSFMGSVVDRRVRKTPQATNIWTSAPDQTEGQWVQLSFPVPIWVRAVKLYDAKQDPGSMTGRVHKATVQLYSDELVQQLIRTDIIDQDLTQDGQLLTFNDEKVQSIRVYLDSVSGRRFHQNIATIGEIEVIASGGPPQVVSLEEIEVKNQSFKVYPNPFEEVIWLENVSGENIEIDRIRVLDAAGGVVFTSPVKERPSNRTSLSFELGKLGGGVYFLEVKLRKGTSQVYRLIR
jgi:hypothetical protein